MEIFFLFIVAYNFYITLRNPHVRNQLLSSVTLKIMIANLVVFLITGFGTMYAELFANAYSLTFQSFQLYRLITAMFYHYGLIHLLCNMSCLIGLGLAVEETFGKKAFCISYFITGIIGGAIGLVINQILGYNVLSAGSSGAIFGLLGILISNLPGNLQTKISVTIQSFLPVIILGFLGGIDNATHIAGFIAGIVVYKIYLNRNRKI